MKNKEIKICRIYFQENFLKIKNKKTKEEIEIIITLSNNNELKIVASSFYWTGMNFLKYKKFIESYFFIFQNNKQCLECILSSLSYWFSVSLFRDNMKKFVKYKVDPFELETTEEYITLSSVEDIKKFFTF